MMQELVKHLLDSLVEILTVAIFSIGSLVLQKVKAYFHAKLTDSQYNLMVQISKDIYEFVEREYGEKLGKTGREKLQLALEEFEQQMQKHGLPYTANDFILQVEKIIRQERIGQGINKIIHVDPVNGNDETPSNQNSPTTPYKTVEKAMGDVPKSQ